MKRGHIDVDGKEYGHCVQCMALVQPHESYCQDHMPREVCKEDVAELKAIYVKFDEAQTTDYYATDDVFGWYDGVTHVSRETWDEYQRLRKQVNTIEALMYKDIRFYSSEEGQRP